MFANTKTGAPLLLLLLVASLAVGCSAKLDVLDAYLPRADAQPVNTSPFLQETLAAMVKHPLPAGSSDEMLAFIKDQQNSIEDLKELDFFEELYNLSADDDKCTPNLRRYVLAILTLARETSHEPAVESYVAFLKSSIPKTKLGQCALNTGEEFARVLERYARKDEEALDQLFAAYGTAHGQQDEQLYSAAQGMDLARGDYDVRQMLKVSKEIMPAGDRERERAERDQLAWFIHAWCLRMQEPLKNVLAIFNLARGLGARVPTDHELPAKFLKLNEYNRVCLSFQKNRAQAELNIERQLRASAKTVTAKAKRWYKG